MFLLSRRKKVSSLGIGIAPGVPKGFTCPELASALLATPRRQRLLEHIWQRTSVSRPQFKTLYRAPIERYAELVQQFPASESHHHSYPGGMLDHGLEIIAYALKLRQSHLLPIGAPPESQAAQSEAWTAGITYGALLHDIGKVAVDLHVEFADGKRWHPWHGKPAQPYRFHYRKDREYRLHGAGAGLLYTDVLDKRILDWLSGFPELWAALIYLLAGQYEHAGILGEIVQQADQASVAQSLGGDPSKVCAAPKHALQRKLLDGLKYLVKEELKLNQSQASDGWLTQDALWLVSKTVCDKLRAHLLSQGIDGVPERNTDVFNVLQEHGIAQATPDGKAIWRATVSGDNGWTNSFTFLRVSPALVWDMGERPAPFNGAVRVEDNTATAVGEAVANNATVATPEDTSRASSISTSVRPGHSDSGDAVGSLLSLLDKKAQISAVPDNERTPVDNNESDLPARVPPPIDAHPVRDEVTLRDEAPGVRFMSWLRNAIQSRHLKINDAKALVHTVGGTVYLVSPGIFQRYAQEYPQVAHLARGAKLSDWEWTQKNFEHLRVHKKQANGLNIWTCAVTGPRKSRRLHGYLLKDGSTVIPDLPFDNPHLKLLETDVEAGAAR